jgi:hypothetical protein
VHIFDPKKYSGKARSIMRISRRILYTWLAILAVFTSSFMLLPSKDASWASFMSCSLQALLFIICLYIIRREPIRKNKFIFVNFALFFSLSFLAHAYFFVGKGTAFFADQEYLKLYIIQYVSFGLYFFLLAVAIIYLTMDVLFRDFQVYQKYAISICLTLMFFGYYYAPYFEDPKYLYHTADVLNYKILDANYTKYSHDFGEAPTPATLASISELYSWKHDQRTGILFQEAKLERVNALYPYLEGDNWKVLLYRPVYLDAIQMSVVCIGFILLFFGYLYMKDPPQGAYIEKIMFLFLVFCSLEVLHSWTAIKLVEWEAASSIWTVGVNVSDGALLLLVGAFSMRLRFITSVKGEFYEQELALSPSAVTRWRDSLDNLVVEKFFNRKLILGRMFVAPNRKQ